MPTNILKDLGNHLVIKYAVPEDTDRLSDFNARALSDQGPEHPEEMIRDWTRDLMTLHPTNKADDFLFVEDTLKEQIVSSLCIISQTWLYENIPFGVGRVELVSTDRGYRRRGLVRAQFDILHEWSRSRGEQIQAITGIPYFYRQFGYEMALPLGGGRRGYQPHVPSLKEGQEEPFQMRSAHPDDIPFIKEMYALGQKRSLISSLRTEEHFLYEMQTQHDNFRGQMNIIETAQKNEPVGFLWHSRRLHNGSLSLFCYELKPGISWAAATPTVIRYLKQKGHEIANEDEKTTWSGFTFDLGTWHPAYEAAPKALPETFKPYAWYIRIPDLSGFLMHISPVLNSRLAASAHTEYTGELLLDFHRTGVKLVFDNGKITQSEPWQPSTDSRGDLAFPDLTFINLVCGHKSFDELEAFFPDCYTRNKPEAPALINILFPKRSSSVLGIV